MAILEEQGELLEQVRTHAFLHLSWAERQTTNLYADHRIIEPGEPIGPPHQEIAADRRSLLVFADENPRANFGHPCRYLLYDVDGGKLHREVPAQFPPFVRRPPETLRAFHEPIQILPTVKPFRLRPFLRCPIIFEHARYAILFSGMSNKRHLNDLEFLYRTLIDRYGFAADHIYALSYDGTLDTQDGLQTNWPGDGTPYRIQLRGEGTRPALEGALDDLKGRLDGDDLLLIHTNNHGGYDGTPGAANLCTYPNWAPYYANDFANKLAQLPRFSKLIVMMEQCHAGGFNAPILAKSTADATSVASAAIETKNSYVSADGNWDPFARDWIAAQTGHDPFGGALAFSPDADGDGRIEAEEAFSYANAIRDPMDSPNFSESSEAGGDIALGREYTVWKWWCWIIFRYLEPHYLRLPTPEYYERIHEIQPELAKLAQTLDERSAQIEKEVAPRIQEIIEGAFRDR